MNSRRSFVKKGALAAAAIVATDPLRAFAGVSSSIYGGQFNGQHSLSILHTGDLGAQLDPIMDGSRYQGLGGFHRLTTIINELRNRIPASLLLDAGEMEEALFPLAAAVKYDALQVEASKMSNAAALPVISIHPLAKKYGALPYRILHKGNIRVGIISARIETGNTANVISSALETSEYLKKQEECNIVICLSNLGIDKRKKLNDYMLASRSTHIDLIIGSGKGSILRTPHTCFNRNKGEVIINHCGYGGLVLGKIDFQFNEKGEKTGLQFRNLVIGRSGYSWKGLPSEEKQALA